MGAEKTWPSIFVTAAFFKVSSLPAGNGSGGEGVQGKREMADREGDNLTAQQG